MDSPQKLKQLLHQSLQEALGGLTNFSHCALLSYPEHYNIGDHLIWLGTLFYCTQVLKVPIKYVASVATFSGEEMDKQVGTSPIFFHGGGNLGDLWSYYQRFYEKIISSYPDRPIIFWPQSIYFRFEDRLNRAKEIFNAHPNLTLIARENRSYELAQEHFTNCKIFKAPDMALQMIDLPSMLLPPKQKNTILYLCRQDGELNKTSSPDFIDFQNIIVEDWASYRYKGMPSILSLKGVNRLFQHEWLSRQLWQRFHPYTSAFNTLYNPDCHYKSWNFMHNGWYQFKQHRVIITNRLHGHLLCIILGIPHVFLANAYYKNESFYTTWTYQLPFCKFVKEASQIKPAIQKLLEQYDP